MKPTQRAKFCKPQIALLFVLFALGSIIPIRLAIAQHQAPEPQAVLVLEGSPERVKFAAQFSQAYPTLPVWISGNPGALTFNQALFEQVGIPEQQVHYDFCATDTVTNFTCNADTLAAQGIQHIYVITSDYHMPRSLAIAAIVLGSRGIFVTPISVTSGQSSSESLVRIFRDCVRSMVWVLTGRTGAGLRDWV
ncbi:YdcF family protein [Egbenema bharatensis]|uniref:YdcF family protein n=1 Tax=Egbenema bharatensis TaxID=3463334 RepID=UPI003A85163E